MLLPDAHLRAKEIARIRRLAARQERDATGLHYIEGLRQVFCALDSDLPLHLLVYCEALAPAIAQKRVRIAKHDGCRVLRLTPEQFRGISTAPRASGIGAILSQHWLSLDDAKASSGLCWIALGLTRSAGNLGTVLRTAEAAGAGGIIFLEGATDPFDPQVVRASMGGIFGLRLVRATHRELAAWAARHRCRVIGTSPGGDSCYTDVSLGSPLVLLFGEERKGLTERELALCGQTVRFPTVGRADSLNLGVATAVMLFDLRRRSTLA
jgi:TrmH family RNA methyltransferase